MNEPTQLTNRELADEFQRIRALGGKLALAVGEDGVAFDLKRGYSHLTRGDSPLRTRDGASLMVRDLPEPAAEPEPEKAAATSKPPKKPGKETRGGDGSA